MAQKILKRFAPLLSFILMISFLISPALSRSGAIQASAAFVQSSGEFDYAMVMSEPKTQNTNSVNAGSLSKSELKGIKLYPGGVPFGVKFITEGILIVGFAQSSENPSQKAGLKINDRILSIGGKALSSSEELTSIIKSCNGKALSVIYLRDGTKHSTTIKPIYSKSEGCYTTGAYVKDNGAGIGTVTYIVPQTLSFAGLGHGICEGDNGQLVPIQRGSVVNVTISGVVKGQKGIPGEVNGYFSSGKTGSLLKNSNCGVFGVFASLPNGLPSEPLSLGLRDEITEGKAHIYCTLDAGTPQKYEIEISSIDRTASEGKCFTVKVTDPALLSKTGGIVQGMSGSPIIQNGKLVGAVTHVMINDPTAGYGIFIENMLNAAQSQVMPKVA